MVAWICQQESLLANELFTRSMHFKFVTVLLINSLILDNHRPTIDFCGTQQQRYAELHIRDAISILLNFAQWLTELPPMY